MFDDPTDLLRKIRLGEDSTLECKAVSFKGRRVDGPRRDDLADELAAMANTGQGIVVLGVDDKTREVVGIPLDLLDVVDAFVRQICEDSIRPALFVHMLRLDLPDADGTPRPVLKVEVPRSFFVHESPGGYYYRVGSSKRKLPPDRLARLFQQRSQARLITFEEQAVPGASFADLDERLWRRFLGSLAEEPVVALHKMKLLTRTDSGSERATVAGVLMASDRPHAWLPNAYVEAVRYRGTYQDSHHQVDALRIEGSLDRQIRDALAFVRRNMSTAAIKAPGRIEFPQFSVRAVFEAVVNAVAHRDYSIHGSKIRILQFDDRCEIYSPGALPNSLTIDSLPFRQSTRNELVTSLLARCRVEAPGADVRRQFLMEKRGDGVPVILRESLELSGREPEYRLFDGEELLLTIWAAKPPDPDSV
jgi:predicted HTH transcriptional regulator